MTEKVTKSGWFNKWYNVGNVRRGRRMLLKFEVQVPGRVGDTKPNLQWESPSRKDLEGGRFWEVYVRKIKDKSI